MFRTLLTAAAVAVVMTPVAHAEALKEINFGIISTESTQNLKTMWDPFLVDMEKKLGVKVKAFFAPDYAGVIEGMRFKKVDVAWLGNKAAMEAVDRANAEVFVQTAASDGAPGYWSLLIAHKDSPLNDLKDVLKCDKSQTFGNGDPNSTSGFLVPSYYVFSQNNVDPKDCFKNVRSANHETNLMAVANKQVDIATNNTENFDRLKKTNPQAIENVKVLWKSPLIPADPIAWRKDLDDADKKKISDFFLTYGANGDKAEAEREMAVLKGLTWGQFRKSGDYQLIPIRQLTLFKDRAKIAGDTTLSDADRTAKLAELDAKLEDLKAQAAKAGL